MEIYHRRRFRKQFQILPVTIRNKFHERLAIFLDDPFAPILNNHSLNHPYAGCRSINITGDYRAVYAVIDEVISFVAIGTHSQLYG